MAPGKHSLILLSLPQAYIALNNTNYKRTRGPNLTLTDASFVIIQKYSSIYLLITLKQQDVQEWPIFFSSEFKTTYPLDKINLVMKRIWRDSFPENFFGKYRPSG